MRLLIFDAKCPYCKGIAALASKAGGITTLAYQTPESQKLLGQAFDDAGFTLYLFDDDTVYWGSHAARRTSQILSLPGPIVDLITRLYPYLVRIASILSRRTRTVRQPECNCEIKTSDPDTGGEKSMDDGTAALLQELFS